MDLKYKLYEKINIILDNHFTNGSYEIKEGFSKVLGGADTEIFSFKVNLNRESKSYDLILRIYREGATIISSKREFEVLDRLYNAGLQVPKPYGFAGTDNSLNRPFLIMEKIDGVMLEGVIFRESLDQQNLLRQFIQNLVNIHSVNWKVHFPERAPPDIENDPFAITKQLIQKPKELIEKYNIIDLKPLITWLESSMKDHPAQDVVLIHGDYHAMNVMVKKNGELVTIDWADVKLGDRRQDLAFAIVALDSTMQVTMKENLVKLYEYLAEIKIEGIEYFMVLSVLYNFIRVYSMLFNYEITGENNITRDTMIGEYKPYVLYFINVIKKVTKLNFPQIEKKLNMKK